MRSSSRKKKDSKSSSQDEPEEAVVESTSEASSSHVASMTPDNMFFDEGFSPVVDKILGRKISTNEAEEEEELFFVKVCFKL